MVASALVETAEAGHEVHAALHDLSALNADAERRCEHHDYLLKSILLAKYARHLDTESLERFFHLLFKVFFLFFLFDLIMLNFAFCRVRQQLLLDQLLDGLTKLLKDAAGYFGEHNFLFLQNTLEANVRKC